MLLNFATFLLFAFVLPIGTGIVVLALVSRSAAKRTQAPSDASAPDDTTPWG